MVDRIVGHEVLEEDVCMVIEIDEGYEVYDGKRIKVCPSNRNIVIDKNLLMQLIEELT